MSMKTPSYPHAPSGCQIEPLPKYTNKDQEPKAAHEN